MDHLLSRRRKIATSFVASLVALVAVQAPSFAQFPVNVKNFAVTHLWGSPGINNIRNEAMGGANVADLSDDWHGNPAALVSVKQTKVLGIYNETRFSQLPKFSSNFAGIAFPIAKPGTASLKLAFATVHASGGATVGGQPLNVAADERDPILELGYRVSPKLAVGIGTAYLTANSNYDIAGVGRLEQLKSRPDQIGGRLGAIYSVCPKVDVGATYDNYIERVSAISPVFAIPDTTYHFHDTAYHFGASYRHDAKTSVLADYGETFLRGAGTLTATHGIAAGVEHKLGPVALRLGLYHGASTGGIGYVTPKFAVSYAFSNRYSEDLPGQGAKTASMIQIEIPL